MILLKPTFWIGWGWKYNQSRFKLCETCSQTLISSLSELRVFTLILTLFQQVNVYIAMIRSKGPIDLFDRISNHWHWEQISYLSQLEKYSLWIENISPGISISLLADWELLRFWDKTKLRSFKASKLKLRFPFYTGSDKTCAPGSPPSCKRLKLIQRLVKNTSMGKL